MQTGIDSWQAVWLALVQGITEFLPVSSSAHLILAPGLLGWPDQGLAFDVAVHFGTLIAVVGYFRTDIVAIVHDWLRSLVGGKATENSRLAWYVVSASIPAGIAGILLNDVASSMLRHPLVIAGASIIFGLWLWWADRQGAREKLIGGINFRIAALIGLAQMLALIPGASRSGVTMAAALALGFTRDAAARFSFLLSIPIILAASSLKLLELIAAGADTDWSLILIGVGVSALSAWFCIHWFLKLIQRVGMTPFVVYRVLLGFLLLYLFI